MKQIFGSLLSFIMVSLRSPLRGSTCFKNFDKNQDGLLSGEEFINPK